MTLGNYTLENIGKDKMLVTGISNNVFDPLRCKFCYFGYNLFSARVYSLDQSIKLFGKGLTHYHTIPHFESLKLWKTLWEKKKLLVTSNFSFSHNFLTTVIVEFHAIHFGKSRYCQHRRIFSYKDPNVRNNTYIWGGNVQFSGTTLLIPTPTPFLGQCHILTH